MATSSATRTRRSGSMRVLLYDKEEGDVYFVWPSMMNHPLILPRLRRVTIATAYVWPAGPFSCGRCPSRTKEAE